jgi:DMSO/TMAO reductase YedYZ molybdopterin-dependent catalytic subunit
VTSYEDDDRSLSRRRFLKLAAGGLACAAAAGLSVFRSSGEAEAAEKLITKVSRPFDAETPVEAFASWITPNEQFFVRSHFGPPPPERIAPSSWRLNIKGLVAREPSLGLSDLLRFEEVSVTAVVQCSGNGRAFHRPRAAGVQWKKGAVGNARWTGVRLRDVLAKAGVQSRAKHLHLLGADRPVLPTTPLFLRSIPIEKALHPDTILATKMNDEPLPLLHGAPLRLIAPGWMADACVKWLTDLTLSDTEAPGYYMQTAYRHPIRPVQPGDKIAQADLRPVEAMVVKSLITSPLENGVVSGDIVVQGVAWTGEGKIVSVEVSADEGRTWAQAQLTGEDVPYAWRMWQHKWKPSGSGRATLLCRATDDRGHTQPERSPWNPSGFLWNGWDRVAVEVKA